MQRILYKEDFNSKEVKFVSRDINSDIKVLWLTNYKESITLNVFLRNKDILKKLCSNFDISFDDNFHEIYDIKLNKDKNSIYLNLNNKHIENQKVIEDILVYCKKISNYKEHIEKVIDFLPYKLDVLEAKKNLEDIDKQIQKLSVNFDIKDKLKIISRLKSIVNLKNKNNHFEDVSNMAAKRIANEFYTLCCDNKGDNHKMFMIGTLKYASIANDFDLCKIIIKNEIFKDDNGKGIVSDKDITMPEIINSLSILSMHNSDSVLKSIKELREIVKKLKFKSINKVKFKP